MKVHIAAAVALVGASLVTAGASAQTASQAPPPTAPPMTPILAGKKVTPPIRGQAEIDIVKAPTKREGTTLVTKIQAKNTSAAPIARLRVVETWYDKSGGTIPGGEASVNGLLQPNEIQTLEIRTPVNLNMSTSQLAFSHANGTIKAKAVKSFDAPAEKSPAAAPAKSSAAKKK
ncbi:MAG TPA: hypothetical protein VH497_20560 [Vicinamibacterales bacterium]|jgi:hypothetical protein